MNTKCEDLFFSLKSWIWNIKIFADKDPKYNLFIHMHIIYIFQTFILQISVVMSLIYLKYL